METIKQRQTSAAYCCFNIGHVCGLRLSLVYKLYARSACNMNSAAAAAVAACGNKYYYFTFYV